jgi:hypothetical protein
MYITTGQFIDEAPYLSEYDYMQIYYKSIRNRREDYLTSLKYVWRWDPDWFWCSKVFYMQNPVLRFLFGKFMLKSTAYNKVRHYLTRHPGLGKMINFMRGNQESIIQDILFPIDRAPQFLDFFHREIGIKPIWICPMQPYSKKAGYDFCMLDPHMVYVDFGFWDWVHSDKEEGHYNRKIERITGELNGFKSLYSSSYYSEQEFWNIFNRTTYLKMKQKYDPHSYLNDFYLKCTRRQ